MTARLLLPEKLDTGAVSELLSALRSRQGSDLVLDGEDLAQIGALAVQTIIVAANDWQDGGQTLSFENVSDEVEQQLQLLGTSARVLTEGDIR